MTAITAGFATQQQVRSAWRAARQSTGTSRWPVPAVSLSSAAIPAFLLAGLMSTSIGFGLAQVIRDPVVANVIVNVLIFVLLL
jgi:hypothetical protein